MDHQAYSKVDATGHNACNCIGPRNGEPRCPCMMRNVKVVDGRYVETIDHGPVRSGAADKSLAELLGLSLR